MAATPPDPVELERLASRLERAALEFEDVGPRTVGRVKGLSWTGTAADHFLDGMKVFQTMTGEAADALRALATGLRTGAKSIRDAQSG